MRTRLLRQTELDVNGQAYEVQVRSVPFREGVEVSSWINGEMVRISDRQLGEQEALRLLKQELERRSGIVPE